MIEILVMVQVFFGKFGSMERKEKFKEYSWDNFTKYKDENWENFDFTKTNFDNVFFENVTFRDCLFDRSIFDHISLFNCNFVDCVFMNVNLRSVAIGAEGGQYVNCIFFKCDFRGQSFEYPFMKNCTFENCKLSNINFNDTIFHHCKFIGKIDDVTFNGMYHKNEINEEPLLYVDFSMALFGDFVNFDSCDLSTCVPPVGQKFSDILYQVDENQPKVISTGTIDKIVIRKE